MSFASRPRGCAKKTPLSFVAAREHPPTSPRRVHMVAGRQASRCVYTDSRSLCPHTPSGPSSTYGRLAAATSPSPLSACSALPHGQARREETPAGPEEQGPQVYRCAADWLGNHGRCIRRNRPRSALCVRSEEHCWAHVNSDTRVTHHPRTLRWLPPPPAVPECRDHGKRTSAADFGGWPLPPPCRQQRGKQKEGQGGCKHEKLQVARPAVRHNEAS